MRVLFCGDVVGRAGRKVLLQALPELRAALKLDAVVVNGENAAGGFGITESLCQDFYAAGADLITTGNHVFDQRDVVGYSERDPRLIRPLNMAPGTPGRGSAQLALIGGRKLLVVQVIGRLFMGAYDDPFRALEAELAKHPLGAAVQAIVIDLHAEATSEKMALAHLRDPYPRADGGRADPARRHRLHLRHRHDRRLRFGDRHEQGDRAAALPQPRAGAAQHAGTR
jgi:2',3'-cyclic-nucleotide 2'-phosphodiesterase